MKTQDELKALVPAGTVLTAVGTRDYPLTKGKGYEAINGYEAGVFADRPYVSFIDDNGAHACAYLRRFTMDGEELC